MKVCLKSCDFDSKLEGIIVLTQNNEDDFGSQVMKLFNYGGRKIPRNYDKIVSEFLRYKFFRLSTGHVPCTYRLVLVMKEPTINE